MGATFSETVVRLLSSCKSQLCCLVPPARPDGLEICRKGHFQQERLIIAGKLLLIRQRLVRMTPQ